MEKYASLIEMAKSAGTDNLTIEDAGDVLRISGIAPSERVKQQLWDEYGRIDPDMRAGDLVLTLEVAPEEYYVVERGDSLSRIAAHVGGVTWQQIFEANRDQIDDADKIFPGQRLRIPRG
jgi:nucleoid-associated protein YgaU